MAKWRRAGRGAVGGCRSPGSSEGARRGNWTSSSEGEASRDLFESSWVGRRLKNAPANGIDFVEGNRPEKCGGCTGSVSRTSSGC